MASENSLRHVEAVVNHLMENGEVENLLKEGLKSVLSALMGAEATEQPGAAYRERAEGRRNSLNGKRYRNFDTGVGTIELGIPKLRRGSYHPSFLKAHQRSDDALVLAVASCYQNGVSTRKMEKVARALGVQDLKKDRVSAMAKALDPHVEAFQNRELGEFPYIWLDARYEFVREKHRVRKVAVLVAIGTRRDGRREVLGFAIERVENEAYWDSFLDVLVERGLTGTKLAISDAHEGLRRAIAKRLPSAKWQRCRVHFMRNLGQRFGKRQRPAYLALAKTVFAQESLEAALEQRAAVAAAFRQAGREDAAEFLENTDEVLTYMDFPTAHWSKLHSTNVIERLNRELKRRTRVVSIFPGRASLRRLVGALLVEEHEEWLVGRRYISERSMDQLYSPLERLELGDDPTKHLAAAK